MVAGGWSPLEWTRVFYLLSRHLPGFGGLASYDALEESEVLDLLQHVRRGLEREAAAYK